MLADEAYLKITYDGRQLPDILAYHPNVIIVRSHSKDLGLSGERIGYALISPTHQDRQELRGAMTFVNRTLGYVNAPALFQWVAAYAQRCRPQSRRENNRHGGERRVSTAQQPPNPHERHGC